MREREDIEKGAEHATDEYEMAQLQLEVMLDLRDIMRGMHEDLDTIIRQQGGDFNR